MINYNAYNSNRNQGNQVRVSQSYDTKSDGRHWGDIKIRAFDGNMKSIRLLFDSGNDITILTKSTAQSLGYDPRSTPGGIFHVKGINGAPKQFREIHTDVIIGNIPLKIPIGLAFEADALTDNLLGRAGVLDSGKIAFLFDNDSVDVIDRRSNRVSVCGNMM